MNKFLNIFEIILLTLAFFGLIMVIISKSPEWYFWALGGFCFGMAACISDKYFHKRP